MRYIELQKEKAPVVKNTFRALKLSKPLKKGIDTEILREFDDEGIMLSGGDNAYCSDACLPDVSV